MILQRLSCYQGKKYQVDIVWLCPVRCVDASRKDLQAPSNICILEWHFTIAIFFFSLKEARSKYGPSYPPELVDLIQVLQHS